MFLKKRRLYSRKMNVFYLVFSLVCVIDLLLIGYSWRLNKEYEYVDCISTFKYGLVTAKLLGSYKSKDGLTVKGTPYDLALAFEMDKKYFEYVEIVFVDIYDVHENEKVFNHTISMQEAFYFDPDKKYISIFLFENIDLDYNELKLKIKFNLLNKNEIWGETEDLIFKKKYNEHYTNDFWQGLMGI